VKTMEKENTKKEALEDFVARELYANQTSLVEKAVKEQIFLLDEIYNLYREFDGLLLSPNVCSNCKRECRCLDSETGECEFCFEANQMPQEIFEWWLVSAWLGKKLLLEGEPVIDNGYGVWWGRTTTGQAIAMDEPIGKIFDVLAGYTA
jgi:hypothetical protein